MIFVGRAGCPSLIMGGQDVHPTKAIFTTVLTLGNVGATDR